MTSKVRCGLKNLGPHILEELKEKLYEFASKITSSNNFAF